MDNLITKDFDCNKVYECKDYYKDAVTRMLYGIAENNNFCLVLIDENDDACGIELSQYHLKRFIKNLQALVVEDEHIEKAEGLYDWERNAMIQQRLHELKQQAKDEEHMRDVLAMSMLDELRTRLAALEEAIREIQSHLYLRRTA